MCASISSKDQCLQFFCQLPYNECFNCAINKEAGNNDNQSREKERTKVLKE